MFWMFGRVRREVCGVLLAATICGSLGSPALAGDWLSRIRGKWQGHKGIPTAEALAAEIDGLEKHLNWYGSIVAKQPDVWGQARLMKYRQEFEKTLLAELGNFKPTLQASISRTDQAFLAQALSLSAAISGAPATLLPPSESTSREVVSRRRSALKAAGVANPTPEQLGAGTDPPSIAIPTENPAGELIDDEKTITRNEVKTTAAEFAGGRGIQLEPTVFLDQLDRYVNHLQEIRRRNEGDDTADSPGYALHLVRIPVSILPGTHTRKGFGAEVTVTATPQLGRDLLPTTFRSLVVNDLVEQISTPLAEFFNSEASLEEFRRFRAGRADGVKFVEDYYRTKNIKTPIPILGVAVVEPPASASLSGMSQITAPRSRTFVQAPKDSGLSRTGLDLPAALPQNSSSPSQNTPSASPQPKAISPYKKGFVQGYSNYSPRARSSRAPAMTPPQGQDEEDQYRIYSTLYKRVFPATRVSVVGSRSRNARFAFPTVVMPQVYGGELITTAALEAHDMLLRRPIDDDDEPDVVQYQKLAGYVQDQVTAAQDFLARPENLHLWTTYATPALAAAVQSRDEATLHTLRCGFLAALPGGGLQNDATFGPRYTTLAAFSWAVIVESVLLNERLIQDIGEAATAKGGLPPVPGDQMFFLPCPSDESRDAFNQYVRTRFPIHVFAVDPINQEQNIADDLSRTRELQLALSMAFVTGNISASSMTRFARRLELQTETVALNRTQIAFSHGDDIFGWRFQPRYQTPPTQGNLTVAFRDNLLGGPTREQDRRQLELEPGMRECVAIVIMPSFVPYVTFETRTNWYRLNSPKHSEIDASKFLGLSASIKRAYSLAQNLCDSGLYRDGDVGLLINRVKQLAARLPMQSMIAQMPFENTSGGFELFNVGVTDLAPELRSWYGAPGISPDNGASLFLVGDNFSVNQTSVVVGNKQLGPDDFQLLSRQVMRVSVPPGAHQVVHGGKRAVEASVATPYGVSQSVYIPVYEGPRKDEPAAAPAHAPTFSWAPETFTLGFKNDGLGIAPISSQPQRPEGRLLIKLDSDTPLAPTVADLTLLFEKEDRAVNAITLPNIPYDNDLGGFVIEGGALTKLTGDLFAKWRHRFGPKNPPRDLVASRTILSLRGAPAGAPIIPQDVSNALTIKWQEVTKP